MILVAKLSKNSELFVQNITKFLFLTDDWYKSLSAFLSTLTGVVLALTAESLPCYLTEPAIIGCSAWDFQVVKPLITTAHLFHRESVIDCCEGGKVKLGSVII